ncbi:MAG TPA: vitamin K epoxide reductase family protein [Gemmatimonadaceae bacterium]|nr:vitamin K epoxide reductase family protein [Gemmatimonadaceae bacterium]
MTRRMWVAVLSLLGLFIALYLTLYKVGAIGQLSCSVGSCETVNTSRWSLLAGQPVAAWGAGLYALILVVALAGVQDARRDAPAIAWALTLLSGWGVLFSGYLTYVELFRIHAICIWCVTSASIITIVFVLSASDLARARRTGRRSAAVHASGQRA